MSYVAVILLADIMRRTGIDGTTPPAKARELIMTEFTRLKAIRGMNSYTIRDTRDANIPHTVLVPDVQRKVWKFLD